MARFYGFSNGEIDNMQYDTLQKYVTGIPILQARELLDNITASSFAHNKQSEKIHRKIHKQANPDMWESKKPVTLDKLMGLING